MVKNLFFVSCAFCFLAACDSADPISSAAEDISLVEKTQNDDIPSRQVSLYLEPQLPTSYAPVFDGRVVVAEPVYTVPVSMARAQGIVDGVDVVYVGKDCESLMAKYPDLYDCIEEETVEFEYGAAVSTEKTNSEGFTAIMLGSADKYRLRVQSWPTDEDAKCYWGGEKTVGSNESEVRIPMLVFCE